MVDVYYFTEMPYAAFDEREAEKYPSMRLTFPNTYFDSNTAHTLLRHYFDQYQWAEEAGFDGLMINEHHNTPSCMDVAVNLSAAVLGRVAAARPGLAVRAGSLLRFLGLVLRRRRR